MPKGEGTNLIGIISSYKIFSRANSIFQDEGQEAVFTVTLWAQDQSIPVRWGLQIPDPLKTPPIFDAQQVWTCGDVVTEQQIARYNVALASWFNSLEHFNSVFKKMGIPPRRFRESTIF